MWLCLHTFLNFCHRLCSRSSGNIVKSAAPYCTQTCSSSWWSFTSIEESPSCPDDLKKGPRHQNIYDTMTSQWHIRFDAPWRTRPLCQWNRWRLRLIDLPPIYRSIFHNVLYIRKVDDRLLNADGLFFVGIFYICWGKCPLVLSKVLFIYYMLIRER